MPSVEKMTSKKQMSFPMASAHPAPSHAHPPTIYKPRVVSKYLWAGLVEGKAIVELRGRVAAIRKPKAAAADPFAALGVPALGGLPATVSTAAAVAQGVSPPLRVYVLLTDCAIKHHKLKFDHLWISLSSATCVDLWTLVHLVDDDSKGEDVGDADSKASVLGWNLCAFGTLEEYEPGKCGMAEGSLIRLDPRKHKRRWLFTSRNAPKLCNAW